MTKRLVFRGTRPVNGSSDLIGHSDFGFGHSQPGFILVVLLTATALVLALSTSLAGLVASEFRRTRRTAADEQAFWVAESGLGSASWRASLNPILLKNSSLITLDHFATDGTSIGQSRVEFAPASGNCGITAALQSTGETPNLTARRLIARTVAKTNIANFAMLSGGPLWISPEVEIKGSIHSNTGIRLDGKVKGDVTAGSATYRCGPDEGCDPAQDKPGVWGLESKNAVFPSAVTDLEGLIPNYETLRTTAQGAATYLEPSGGHGWHLRFNNNNDTVDVALVNQLDSAVCAYDGGPQTTAACKTGGNASGRGWFFDAVEIKRETPTRTLTLPAGGEICNPQRIIFIEDNAWIEGAIPQRLTIVVANVPDPQTSRPRLIIPNNIGMPQGPGARVLLMSQGDIRFGLGLPDEFKLNALLVAPQGRIIRPRYLGTNRIRSKFALFGSTVAPFVRWSWYDTKTGVLLSGFQEEKWRIDETLIQQPPPATPTLEGTRSSSWRELPAPPL